MKKNILNKERSITALFWIMLYFTFWLQVMPQTKSLAESLIFPFVLLTSIYPIAGYLSGTLLHKAMKCKRFKRFMIQFMVFSLLTSALVVLNLLFFSLLEKMGLYPVSEYFSLGISVSSILIILSSGILMNLCFCGLRFFLEYVKLQKIMLKYQLQTLQNQVTPHFMFNVLNHIHVLMQTDVALASALLLEYSEILRYQLYSGGEQQVKLNQEIQFLKDFIAVEEVRWSDKLTINCHWEIEDRDKRITPLLFIPFVENAFKHVSKTNIEKGYIHLNFKQEGNKIQLEIENSKSILPCKKDPDSGIGLKNIKDRLDILYYHKYSLKIKEEDARYWMKLHIDL